jgi:glycerophosphoryl diester phosphodiesterase
VENTIAAFEEARRRGAVAIEFDVRTSKDGEVVVAHDVDLLRISGDRRAVASLARAELERLELKDRTSRIPSLEEVVAWANANGIAMNCELKHDVPSRRVLARRAARVLAEARVPLLVSSFDPVTLALFAREAPGVPRAQLTEHAQGLERSLLHRLAAPPLVQVVHPEYVEIDEAFLARAKARGLRVGTWTVNVPERARRLLAMGVDYVITDDVGAMRDLDGA